MNKIKTQVSDWTASKCYFVIRYAIQNIARKKSNHNDAITTGLINVLPQSIVKI